MAEAVPPYTRWDADAQGGEGEVQLGPNVRSLGALTADGDCLFADVQVTGALSAGSVGPLQRLTIVSALPNALAVGPYGDIYPTFQVNSSAASAANGLLVAGRAAGTGVALSVQSMVANESLLISAKGSGTVTIAGASTGGVHLARPTTVTGNRATALAVGPAGATNPSFVVNAAAAGAQTGVQITAQTAGSGVRVAPVSPAANESMYIDGKGAGPIYLGNYSSASIFIKRAVEASSVVWIDSSSANALAVGADGPTNPALRVDASVAASTTGISVASAATGGGALVSVLSPGADEDLIVTAKGGGAMRLARDSTGDLVIGNGAGYVAFPTTAVPALSEDATDTALVLTGSGPPFPVKRRALTAGFGELNSNLGFSAKQGDTTLTLVAESGCFGFQRIGNVVRLDYTIGLVLLATDENLTITIDLDGLVVADGGCSAVPLPFGGVFANTSSAWGVGNVQSFTPAARLSSAVSVAATAHLAVTAGSGGEAWVNAAATASGTVYYRV